MLNQPTSSPMMKTMFGLFPDEAAPAPAPTFVVAFSARAACASSTFLATPSEQQDGVPTHGSATPASSAACRAAGVATPACDTRVTPLVAARKPSIAPSPKHVTA